MVSLQYIFANMKAEHWQGKSLVGKTGITAEHGSKFPPWPTQTSVNRPVTKQRQSTARSMQSEIANQEAHR